MELNKRIDDALIGMGYKDMVTEEIISPKIYKTMYSKIFLVFLSNFVVDK